MAYKDVNSTRLKTKSIGPNSTKYIIGGLNSQTLKCFMTCNSDGERGPFTMSGGSTYTWTSEGRFTLFIPK